MAVTETKLNFCRTFVELRNKIKTSKRSRFIPGQGTKKYLELTQQLNHIPSTKSSFLLRSSAIWGREHIKNYVAKQPNSAKSFYDISN